MLSDGKNNYTINTIPPKYKERGRARLGSRVHKSPAYVVLLHMFSTQESGYKSLL